MIKLYYVAPFKGIKENVVGIDKKINAQIHTFEKNHIKCYKVDVTLEKDKMLKKIKSLLPYTSTFGNWSKLDEVENPDIIYIRYEKVDYQFMKKIKNLRLSNPNVKILLEIPTYPYDKEWQRGMKWKPYKIKDRINRKKIHKYIDKIITYSNDKKIFNVPTINISNGVDIREIQSRKSMIQKDINMIAVASFTNWHGYDRVIRGLYEYYSHDQKQSVVLHLVGDGPELEKYKQLVEKYKLQDYVIIYGRQTGELLDRVYNQCEIALDAMARHRSGVFYNSSLKGKEYAAKGLPIISGVCTELDYDEKFKYYLRVPADESIININHIVSFYNKVYKNNVSKQEIVKDIRGYAEQYFDINQCLKIVVSYIKGE